VEKLSSMSRKATIETEGEFIQIGLQAGDLVGDTNHPAFYSQFDDAGTTNRTDGTLAFRVRLNRVKDESKMTFNYKLFIGIDANQDGCLDLFVA